MKSYGHDPVGAHAEHVEIEYPEHEPRRSRKRRQIVDQALMKDILGHPTPDKPSAAKPGGKKR